MVPLAKLLCEKCGERREHPPARANIINSHQPKLVGSAKGRITKGESRRWFNKQ